MIGLLKEQKVLICAGTGGVGKTTLSAALGVLAAREGLRTLVLTIDPAQRLAQSLGIENKPGVTVKVEGAPGLSACMIDPRREFDEFVLGSLDSGLAKQLFDNRLYQQLVGNLNGSQEFTSLVRLLNSARSRDYDLIILDTPPTQNAVDFLKAPDRLYALFQDTVIGWFANPNHDESWVKRTIHRGTRLVTTALEAVTGSTFIAELKDFFSHISHLRGRISQISREVTELLHDPRTGFVLVTGFDESKLKEALEFQNDLSVEDLRLLAVIVNRWFPQWTEQEKDFPSAWTQNADFKTLKDFHSRFTEFFEQRQEAFDRFVTQLGSSGKVPSPPVLKLPDFKNTVQGLEDLNQVATTITEKWRP